MMKNLLMLASLCLVCNATLAATPTSHDAATHDAPTSKAPALREQISLNGEWPVGGKVPNYSGAVADEQVYERRVTVPAAWKGKRVQLEFGAVNFLARVSVDGAQVAEHVGGWSPFVVDLSEKVAPGREFALKVVVSGASKPPLSDGKGHPLWPVGGRMKKCGIADDVWLRAYGTVAIEDAFIQTSWRDKTLTVDYTLHNWDVRPRTVQLQAQARRAVGGADEKRLQSTVTLAANERKTVRLREAWPNAALYWPDQPVLYHLHSTLSEGATIVDEETRRFGFREIWIEGNQFKWNGVRINLYGDYQSINGGYHTSASDLTPKGWAKTIDKMQALNIRVMRFHQNPAPQYLLDICDEKGLLICSEASNYAREFLVGGDRETYIANSLKTIGPWIIAQRNHPSIYIWNATNEMTYPQLGNFTPEQCKRVGEEIARFDPTRTVGYDGDTENGRKAYGRVEGACVNYHYPEGYDREPKGSIYSWAKLVNADKPTGSGELLHPHQGKPKTPQIAMAAERNKWWLGIWTRGLRASNWTDVRPAVFWFAAPDLKNPDPLWRQRGLNLQNAYAPVALFDKEYDDLGIAPYVTGTTPGGVLPVATAGATLKRTLILFNDEFRDTRVSVEVQVKVGGQTRARGTHTYDVALGEHLEIPCTFQVPFAGGEIMELQLTTSKGGQKKFEETRRFRIEGAATGTTAAEITLGQPR